MKDHNPRLNHLSTIRVTVCYPILNNIKQTLAFVTISDGIIEDEDYPSSNINIR